MQGIKHLIECHCILPQYRKRKDAVFHKFIVFSVIVDNDKVVEKIAKCNNCAALHRITEICKSEIVIGKEDVNCVSSIDDIKTCVPNDLCDVLESYDVDLPTWEHAQFILENRLWGDKLVLTKEEIDSKIYGKILTVKNRNSYKVESFSMESEMEG